MNEQNYQQLENLEVEQFNRWVRYDRLRRGHGGLHLPHRAYRNGPVAKVLASIFWICVAIWIIDAIYITL